MQEKTIHLVGQAHIDPVWLWRAGDGLAEIRATFRSALDRIEEFDTFVFTCAGASYYAYIEENCPEMFAQIQAAVRAGRWHIVGGMWLQPDCNIPSSESFARHMLYSQRYFYEKFGCIARTGYNVDSFGHAAGLPSLLRAGGMENYIFMRPAPGDEMAYPFAENAFRWQQGEDEVLAFRLNDYCMNEQDLQDRARTYEAYADLSPTDMLMFFGVGDHGGGPTIRQIQSLLSYRETARHPFVFSDPDTYFDTLRQGDLASLPTFQGELQNHASGCYAANSAIKRLNRRAESYLTEGEVLTACAARVAPSDGRGTAALRRAWKDLLFHQFHDILAGTCIESACEEACHFMHGTVAEGMRQIWEAAERISWQIDTTKGITPVSKEQGTVLWEKDDMGTPIVVVNPLSHAVRVPVSVRNYGPCRGLTDEQGVPLPFQSCTADYANGPQPIQSAMFLAELPPLGWRTYWYYGTQEKVAPGAPVCRATAHTLQNDCLTVHFDPESGCIRAFCPAEGAPLPGMFAARAIVIDDSGNDTWAHKNFVFDREIGSFTAPEFTVLEEGQCCASLRVRQTWRHSTLEQTYTLYPADARLHVTARLTMNDPLVSVKLCFDTGMPEATWQREVPGGVAVAPWNGREMPMLRYMLAKGASHCYAVVNDGKYSASAQAGEMRMLVARTCYYADHYGPRPNDRLHPQDMGEQTFSYVILPQAESLVQVTHTAEELHTLFPVIPETYHAGALPQQATHFSCDAPGVSLTAWKTAEDDNGYILRLTEIGGQPASGTVHLWGTTFPITLRPHQILTLRLTDAGVSSCDFTEL